MEQEKGGRARKGRREEREERERERGGGLEIKRRHSGINVMKEGERKGGKSGFEENGESLGEREVERRTF